MKANELMIGDWVYFHGEYPFAVSALYHNAHHPETTMVAGREDGHIRAQDVVEDLKPIPLTEEILKANGAKFQQPKYWLLGGLSMWLSEKEDCYMTRMGAIAIADSWIYFHYVHKLQHALRLCGLNDLADNFKLTIEEN